MVRATIRALMSVEGVLTVLVIVGIAGGAAIYTGVVEEGDIPGAESQEWTGEERLEQNVPWPIQLQEKTYTGEKINNEINQERHNRGIVTLEYTQMARNGAEYYPVPENDTGDVYTERVSGCSGSSVAVTTVQEYESKYKDNQVRIGASISTIANDVRSAVMDDPQRREVVLNDTWSSHGVDVRVESQGTVRTVQTFCES